MGILRLYHILPFSPSSYYHRCQVEAEQLKFSSFMRMCLAVFPLLGFLMSTGPGGREIRVLEAERGAARPTGCCLAPGTPPPDHPLASGTQKPFPPALLPQTLPGKPENQMRCTDIDQHREGGRSEIESHQAIQNCKKSKVAHLVPWKRPVFKPTQKGAHL